MYRLNTYPFIHLGFFHAFLNILALIPLLERFEAEHGTLTSAALFLGRTYKGNHCLNWSKLSYAKTCCFVSLIQPFRHSLLVFISYLKDIFYGAILPWLVQG